MFNAYSAAIVISGQNHEGHIIAEHKKVISGQNRKVMLGQNSKVTTRQNMMVILGQEGHNYRRSSLSGHISKVIKGEEDEEEDQGKTGWSYQGKTGRSHHGKRGRSHQGKTGRPPQGKTRRSHQGKIGRSHQGKTQATMSQVQVGLTVFAQHVTFCWKNTEKNNAV